MDKLDDINQSKELYFFTQPSHNNSWEKTKKPRRPFWVVRFPNTCQHTSYLSILVHRRIIEVYKKYTKKLSELATK